MTVKADVPCGGRRGRLCRAMRRALWPAVAVAVLFLLVWFALPWLVPLPEDEASAPLTLFDRNGRPLAFLPDRGGDVRSVVRFEELPQALVDAVLVAEDRRFEEHGGVDVLAVVRAAASRVGLAGRASGASTIHGQLAKLMEGSSSPERRTWGNKVRELLQARRMAMCWSREEVLVKYFARLGYGNQCFGPEAASFFYFGKGLRELSLAQCALLAALPNAPSRLNPLKYPERAKARRDWILRRLESERGYSREAVARALAEPLDCSAHRRRPWGEVVAPHVVSRVQRGHDAGSLRCSLDVRLQRQVERIAREEVGKLAGHRVSQAAVVVLDNATGEPLAWLGSVDRGPDAGGLLDGVFSVARSSGSVLKPFVYALALERGHLACEVIPDVPTFFRQPDGIDAPGNYDGRFRGPVPMRDALGSSLNIPVMRVLNELGGGRAFGGVEDLLELLRRLGFSTLDRKADEYGLGLAIGTGNVTLYELARAYAVLARLGSPLPVPPMRPGDFPRLHESVPQPGESVLSRETCFILLDVLADVRARAATFGLRSPLRLPFRCAVKTGTSSNYRDNWCVGVTKEVTVAVWVGNYDGRAMLNLGGVDGAGPIFHRVMRAVYEGKDALFPLPGFPEPPGSLVQVDVDGRTGRQPAAGVPAEYVRREWCVRSRKPGAAEACDYADDGRVRLDHRYAGWLDLPGALGAGRFVLAGADALAESPRILVPPQNARYILDPDMPNQGRHVMLKSNLDDARWACDTLKIEMRDGQPVAELQPGVHVIRLVHPSTGKCTAHTIQVGSL